MPAKDWTPEARRDIERRRGSAAGLLGKALSEPLEDRREPGTDEGDGNGRTGFFVNLTVKQVSIALGIAATLATGIVSVWTREPATASAAAPVHSGAPAEPKVETLAAQLKAHVDDLDGMRGDVRETREELRELRGDVRELRSGQRTIERLLARLNAAMPAASNGGGSK